MRQKTANRRISPTLGKYLRFLTSEISASCWQVVSSLKLIGCPASTGPLVCVYVDRDRFASAYRRDLFRWNVNRTYRTTPNAGVNSRSVACDSIAETLYF